MRNNKSNLPATTREVPMKESMAVANLGLMSPRDLEANLHIHVAMPSMMTPYKTGTLNQN